MKQLVVGDLGGTNMRLLNFALDAGERIDADLMTQSLVYAHPEDIADGNHYVVSCINKICSEPDVVVLAVAGPIINGCVRLTNTDWSLSEAELSHQLACPVRLVNDFLAQGAAIDLFLDDDVASLQGSLAPQGNRIITGPGTGLGLCSRPSGQLITLATEAGHAQFAPVTEEEWQVGHILATRFGRVSWERLLSGPGLLNLYQALARLHGQPGHCESAALITEAAYDKDGLAVRTVELFAELLGSYAGDMALAHGATGGVFLSGGLVTHLRPWLEQASIVQRFVQKGRFEDYMKKVPLHLVVTPQPGLLGAAQIARSWSE